MCLNVRVKKIRLTEVELHTADMQHCCLDGTSKAEAVMGTRSLR